MLLLGIVLSKIEIKILKLETVLNEKNIFEIFIKSTKKKILEKTNANIKINFKLYGFIKILYVQIYKEKQDYFLVLNIFGIKINLTNRAKNVFKRKLFKKTTNIINHIKNLNITYSKTNLDINFGTENTFLTCMFVPVITNVIIAFFRKNKNSEIPNIRVSPLYNQNFNLKIYLKSDLKILNIFFKERKNNIKQY